jgi:predicted transcriptional regulator
LESSPGNKNGRRRGTITIAMDILDSLNYTRKITHMIMMTNSSFIIVRRLLDHLQREALVEVGSDGGPRSVYRMTKKGREALEHYNKLLGLLNLGVPRVKKPELFGEEQLAAE